jgi:hypothetical protein
VSLQDVREYILREHGADLEVPLDTLCPNNHVECKIPVIDYDRLRKKIVDEKCTSADALVIGKWINFIEFKTGCAKENKSIKIDTQKENLQLSIRLKAYESLALFEKVILPMGGFETDIIDEKKRFVAVVDSSEYPNDGLVDVLADESGGKEEAATFKAQLHHWLQSKLSNYRKEFGDGKHIFYVDTQVWYDYELPQKIRLLK